jgi:hypothetical protein
MAQFGRRKHHPKTGEIYYEREYDTASLRFLIERFIPPAKTAICFYLCFHNAVNQHRTVGKSHLRLTSEVALFPACFV